MPCARACVDLSILYNERLQKQKEEREAITWKLKENS